MAGKLTDWHDLNGIDAKTFQVLQPCRDGIESARLIEIVIIKCADMQLIDDKLIPAHHGEVITIP